MNQDICAHCKQPFKKYRKDQMYCGEPVCQKARKAKWQREKIRCDPEFRAEQKQATIDWHQKSPGYWRDYRKKTPEKTQRNKILQRIRNQKRRYQTSETTALRAIFNRIDIGESSRLIAKMDVSKPMQNRPFSEFWIVPLIAKMDALKVNISIMSDKSMDRRL